MSGLQTDILKRAVAEKNHVEMDVVVHDAVDSTNSWCLRQSKEGVALPFACFAEKQTSGKGRRGKHWFGVEKANLAVSVAWPFILSKQPLSSLPLSIALAIARTLEHFGIEQVQIKWPNDVYVQGKKIAGILIETQPVKSARSNSVAAVVGVGLNYDMSMYDDDELALTDICQQLTEQKKLPLPERQEIALILLTSIISACQDFEQNVTRNLEKFRTRYDYCKGKNIVITLDDKKTLMGVAQGVNDNAELLVLIEDKLQVFNSAEVSIRAMCGVDL